MLTTFNEIDMTAVLEMRAPTRSNSSRRTASRWA